MITKNHSSFFAVCAMTLFWSFLSISVARADQNNYSDNGNGTVYDAKTGLTWQQDGTHGPYTWAQALAYVESLNTIGFAGCNKWYLPTSKELQRLVDHNKHHGSALINSTYFPNTMEDYYWSSSSAQNNKKYAVSFKNGKMEKKSSTELFYVRAVRSSCGQVDNDGDGSLPGADCNDNDPTIHPGAVDICDDGVDNNCDGHDDLTCRDIDNDHDGQTENQGDCNDHDRFNYLGNTETCDGADNDCDTAADDGLNFDADEDGFTTPESCTGSKDDCNDTNADIHPGAAETCGDVIDQDCAYGDLSCLDVDNDGDGQTEHNGDCNDADPNNYSGHAEVCDGADNDCNGAIDNGLAFTTYYQDSDSDAYGNAAVSQSTCNGTPAGYVTNNTDCNDAAPTANPLAAESCDGLDNNCDGDIDEYLTRPTTCGVGACTGNSGQETCTAGVWGGDTCDSLAGATAETCDNLDNNCDGTIDENLTQVSSCGVGECGATGIKTCSAGTWGNDTCVAGSPTAESCDDLDNNCNGTIDEDLSRATSCGVGACAGNTGVETCTAGAWGNDTCEPLGGATVETCDNLDNNCDGTIDEDLTQATSCGVGECGATGIQTCSAGTWGNDTCVAGTPTAESCDSLDNNCNGAIDEDLTQATNCGVGECGATGIKTCSAGTWGNDTCVTGTPTAESCDNLDNNCDGAIDENLTQATSCGVGECGATGIKTCSAGTWGNDTCVAGTPTAESCDNLDNNCDGAIDDNLTMATSCGAGECGATGIKTCSAGTWGNDTCVAGTPTAESCDNLDNNCDGQIDEGVSATFYMDFDGDLFGDLLTAVNGCSAPPSYVPDNTDCNDTDNSVNPGVVEVCGDLTDNNCNAAVDEGCTAWTVENSGGGAFDSIQVAYNAIGLGSDTIKMQAIVFDESLLLDQDVVVTLAGGYDEFFAAPSGWTTIAPSGGGVAMVIRYGTVIIAQNIILK